MVYMLTPTPTPTPERDEERVRGPLTLKKFKLIPPHSAFSTAPHIHLDFPASCCVVLFFSLFILHTTPPLTGPLSYCPFMSSESLLSLSFAWICSSSTFASVVVQSSRALLSTELALALALAFCSCFALFCRLHFSFPPFFTPHLINQ